MHSKFKLLFLMLLTAVSLSAQDTLFLPRFETQSLKFETAFTSDIRSNALPNTLLSKLLFGGTISDADKDLARFNFKNGFLHSNWNANLRLEHMFNSAFTIKDVGYSIALEQDISTAVIFDKSLYSLIFRGNERFFNTPFSSSKDAFSNTNLSILKVGVLKSFGAQKHKVGIDLGYALVWNYFNLDLQQLDIDFGGTAFNTPNYQANFNLQAPDTAHLFGMSYQGQGFTVSMHYRYSNFKNLDFSIKLVNFGRLYFPNSGFSGSKEIANDSMFFYIPSILDPSESIQNFNAIDSLKAMLFNDLSRKKFGVNSPADVFFDINYKAKNNLQYGIMVRHRFFANWINPTIAFSMAYLYKKQHLFGLLLTKDDYALLDFGLFYKTEYKNGLGFSLGTKYLSSIFLPKHSSGLGGFATFTYKINSYD